MTYFVAFLVDSIADPRFPLPHSLVSSSSTSSTSSPQTVDPWCSAAVARKDIFVPWTTTVDPNTDLSISKTSKESKSSKSRPHIDPDYYKKHTSLDYRYSRISILGVDMDTPTPLKSRFMGYGVVKLYRDGFDDEQPDSQAQPNSSANGINSINKSISRLSIVPEEAESNSTSTTNNTTNITNANTESDDTVVALLAVPGYLTPSDLLGFVTQEYCDHISHFRMVSTEQTNRYMVLIKFRDPVNAHKFQQDFNGKLFNSMEPESCHAIFVKSILFGSEVTQSDEFPYLMEDEFTKRRRASSSAGSSSVLTSGFLSNSSVQDASASGSNATLKKPRTSSMSRGVRGKPPPPPPQSLKELPTCPVCLERMDSNITGLLTILCQHTFHCQCLSKWADGSCPVCRYSQLPNVSASTSQCNTCGSENNLWVCLICGHIGCGRYDQAHAYDHYVATGHCYAMDISSQRVWDYVGDNYIHRLLQNQDDGKLVVNTSTAALASGAVVPKESSSKGKSSSQSYDGDDSDWPMMNPQQIEEELSLQYTRLLSSQLESQREYYEAKLAEAADNASHANARADKADTLLQELLATAKDHETKLKSLTQTMNELEVQKKKNDKLASLCRTLERNYQEEKLMSKQMMEKLETSTKEKEELGLQVQSLEEQLRDVMFFLDAREKLADVDEEVRDGTVEVPVPAPTPVSKNKKKGRRR